MSNRQRDLSLSKYFGFGLNMVHSKMLVLGSHLFSLICLYMYICVNVMKLDMQSRSLGYSQQVGIKPS